MEFYEIIKKIYSQEKHLMCQAMNYACHIKSLKSLENFAIHTGFVCKVQTGNYFEFIYLMEQHTLCYQIYFPNKKIFPLGTLMQIERFQESDKKAYSIAEIGEKAYFYRQYETISQKFSNPIELENNNIEIQYTDNICFIIPVKNLNSFRFSQGLLIEFPLPRANAIEVFYLSDRFYPSKRQYTIEDSSNFDDFPNYKENTAHGKYRGTYAQDVEGCSDDFIDDALDGHPDAYWNID